MKSSHGRSSAGLCFAVLLLGALLCGACDRSSSVGKIGGTGAAGGTSAAESSVGAAGGTTAAGGASGTRADAAVDGPACPPLTDLSCASTMTDELGCMKCASGGTGGGGGSATGRDAGTGSERDSGGDAKRCKVVDGKLAYGPIGERRTLPMAARRIFGFRTAAGYGLVWETDSDATSNLFSMNLDLDFKGGAERAQPSSQLLGDIDVVPVPDGFVVATCSRDSQARWIQLGSDLTATAGASFVAPDAPCKNHAPVILWTGERYLTSFTDQRGLVVAALDAKGSLAAEVVISAGVTESVVARFSKNQDRVLFAYNEKNSGRGLSVVLTLAGTPIGDVQAFGKVDSRVSLLALSPSGDGWIVASNSSMSNDNGLLLTVISRDGLVGTETRAFASYPVTLESTPSAYGGVLVVGQDYSGGQYGVDEKFAILVDEAGRIVYRWNHLDRAFFPVGVIVDPQRDLVIERPMGTDAAAPPLTVLEYGCLD